MDKSDPIREEKISILECEKFVKNFSTTWWQNSEMEVFHMRNLFKRESDIIIPKSNNLLYSDRNRVTEIHAEIMY